MKSPKSIIQTAGKPYAASASSDGTVKIWDLLAIESIGLANLEDQEDKEVHPVETFEVLPCTNFVECDFSGALFESKLLKELVRMNGGLL